MRRRALLLGAGAVGAAAAGWHLGGRDLLIAAATEAYAARRIGAAEAHRAAKAGEIVLVDIRRPDEWARTGIGAGAIPLDMRRHDFVDRLLEAVGGRRDRPVALICARGVRSERLSNRLAADGFAALLDVPEGMLGSAAGPGWLASGLPVVRP